MTAASAPPPAYLGASAPGGSGAIPFRAPDDASLPLGTSATAWLVVAVLLLAGVWAVLKRRAQPWQRGPRRLEVIERQALTPNTQLVITRYAGRRLLLSVGPAGTQLLRDDADDSEGASA